MLILLVNYTYNGVCGSRHCRDFVHRVAVFTADSDRQCWSHFNTGVYGSNTAFSLYLFKYCSNVQTVSETKLWFAQYVPIMTLILF